jgi:hypothetical protein
MGLKKEVLDYARTYVLGQRECRIAFHGANVIVKLSS